MPRGTLDRSLDYPSQRMGDFGGYTSAIALPHTPNPDLVQAQRTSFDRRRSAPNWTPAPVARYLTPQIDHPELQPYVLSPQSHEITNSPSIFGTFTSQTGIPWEAYKCLQCNKVLQDERGLK